MTSIKIHFGLNKRMHLWRGNFGGPCQVHFCIFGLQKRAIPPFQNQYDALLLFSEVGVPSFQNHLPFFSKTPKPLPYCAHNEISNNKSSYCCLFVEAQHLRKIMKGGVLTNDKYISREKTNKQRLGSNNTYYYLYSSPFKGRV